MTDKGLEKRREYRRKYYQRNKERIKRHSQAWRERNPEKVRRSLKAYAERHPEVIAAIQKRYYERTREKRLQQRREYAKRRGPQYGYKLRRAGFAHLADQVEERAGGRCEKCGVTGTPERGKRKLCIHRIDGDYENNVLENLTMICWSCHMTIHAKRGKDHKWWKGGPITLEERERRKNEVD